MDLRSPIDVHTVRLTRCDNISQDSMSQGIDIQVKQKAVEPGIDDRPPCEQAGMPETITNRRDDAECHAQLGGVINTLHRKAA